MGSPWKSGGSEFLFLLLLVFCVFLLYCRLAIYIDPISNFYHPKFNMDLVMSIIFCFPWDEKCYKILYQM